MSGVFWAKYGVSLLMKPNHKRTKAIVSILFETPDQIVHWRMSLIFLINFPCKMYKIYCPVLPKNYVFFCNDGYFASRTTPFIVHQQNEKRFKLCNEVTNYVSKDFFISKRTLLENKDITYLKILKNQIANKFSVSE